MDKRLEKALETLSVICNKSALHVSDEDYIKVTFRVLHKKGIKLNAEEIEEWLLSNEWQSRPAKQVKKWAQVVDSGGRVQLKFKNMAPSEKEIWAQLSNG